jgi:hypothetical protein
MEHSSAKTEGKKVFLNDLAKRVYVPKHHSLEKKLRKKIILLSNVA